MPSFWKPKVLILRQLNYRLVKWLLAVGLLATVPVLAACAGGTTTTPPETITITPPPETITITPPPETVTITPALPQIIESISPQEAFALIHGNQNNPDFVIIDVRTTEEIAGGYIEDAIFIDYYSDTFMDELNSLDKDKVYLIYCRSGGRSGPTLATMEELGFMEVYELLGGILAWQGAGLPVVE